MFRWFSNKKIWLIIVLVIVSLVVLKFTAFEHTSLSQSSFRGFWTPVQGVLSRAGNWVGNTVSLPFEAIGATYDYHELQLQLEDAQGQLRMLEEYKQENQRLNQLLGFQSSLMTASNYQTISASVIGRDSTNWFGTIWINVGSVNGIANNMTVITPSGLVGRIINVTSNSAEVLLITDSRSGVSALTQKSRIAGFVEGVLQASDSLVMGQIAITRQAEPGEVIITAGMDSLYLKGIPIGVVTSVGKDNSGLYNQAVVEPFVDFSCLEEVMVLVSTQDSEISQESMAYPWGEQNEEGGESDG